MRKIEVIYPTSEGFKTFTLNNGPFLIGKNDFCHYLHPHATLDISVLIQTTEDQCIIVTSMDNEIPLVVNNSIVNKGSFNTDTLLKIGDVEFSLSFSYEQSAVKEGNIGNILQMKSLSTESTTIDGAGTEIVQSNIVIGGDDLSSFFDFNTVFDHQDFLPTTQPLYSDKSFQYSHYVELNQELLLDDDKGPIAVENDDHAVKITYMDNGVVLNERFFNYSIKQIYLSNTIEKKNYFKVHNLDSNKSSLVFIKDGRIIVNRQPDFDFHKSLLPGKFTSLDEDFTHLNDGEKIILTMGTTQVIITKAEMPPSLKTESILKIESELAKFVGSGMLLIIPLIFIMALVDIPEPVMPKKEIVVIYNKKKPLPLPEPVPEKKEIEEADEKKITETVPNKNDVVVAEQKNKETEKKSAKEKKPPQRKTTALTPKKVTPEPMTALSKSPRVKQRNQVKKSAQKYKFAAASKFNALLGNTLSTAATQEAKKSNVSESIGKKRKVASSKNVNLNSKLSKISELSTNGELRGSESADVRGLSSKTATNFADMSKSTRVLGAIDPEVVRRLLREHIPYFRSCYQKELRSTPDLSGVFDLNFVINSQGKGIKVDIKTKKKEFSSKGVDCMQRVVQMIQFPSPKGGGFVEVKQPLNFYSNRL